MDIAQGSYVQVGDHTYLVVQHDSLQQLPTLIVLPATPTPLPHRPPLVQRDEPNNTWIHTFAPATILRRDITTTTGRTTQQLLNTILDNLASTIGRF